MNGNPAGLNADPSAFKGSNRPVERVSGGCSNLSYPTQCHRAVRGPITQRWKYVLPTEAHGNMPAGRERSRHSRGAMILILPMPILTGTVDQMIAMIPSKPSMSASFPQTRGAFSICMEMCGNGSTTGRQIILAVPRLILRVRLRARIMSDGVVHGTSIGITSVRLIAIRSTRITVIQIPASV